MYIYQEKTALITGASSGIGAAFARALAAKGMNLILVARSQEKLYRLAELLMQQHAVHVEVVVADLRQEDAAQMVYDTVQRQQRSIDLLINNAGVATYGSFDQQPLQAQQDEILLNVNAVVSLTHLFLQTMIQNGHGAIINVASTVSFQPIPYMAVYGATKAFIISWSEALWAETRQHGITVVTLCPGRTETDIYQVMGTDNAGVGKKVPPEQVVRTGLHALEKGVMTAIDGRSNYWISQTYRVLPRRVLVNLLERMFRPESATIPKKERRPISDRKSSR
jgi:short-subunit dehydrogenase